MKNLITSLSRPCRWYQITALLTAFLAWPAFAQVSNVTQTFFDPAGGPGGAEYYRFECPEHAFVVGLSGYTGDFVDRITLSCKHLNRVSWALEETVSPIKIAPAGIHDLTAGQSNGGMRTVADCKQQTVVFALDFYFLRSNSHYLDWVTGYCAKVNTDTKDNEIYFPLELIRGDNPPHSLQECPPGEWAVGIHGHAGMFVDSIGLICRPFGDRINIKEKVVTPYSPGGGSPLALPWLTK